MIARRESLISRRADCRRLDASQQQQAAVASNYLNQQSSRCESIDEEDEDNEETFVETLELRNNSNGDDDDTRRVISRQLISRPAAAEQCDSQRGCGLGSSSRVLCVLFSLIYLSLSTLLLVGGLANAHNQPQSYQIGQSRGDTAFLFSSYHNNNNDNIRQPTGKRQFADTNVSSDSSLLECPAGWQRHSSQCYRFFQQRKSWPRAKEACERHGGQLALVVDYEQNNFTSQLAAAAAAGHQQHSSQQQQQADLAAPSSKRQASGSSATNAYDASSYWLGFKTIDALETNLLESVGGNFVSKYVGFWDLDEPKIESGDCVRATLRRQKVDPPVASWQLAHCEHLLPFVCQRQVCSSNSFHCNNGRCINSAWKCDNNDDCGDDSDELDCPQNCKFLINASSGSSDKLQSINYPQRYEPNANCKWTLEAPLEASLALQFYEFDTEKHFDSVQVLAGAKTEDKAFSLASLSGRLNLSQRALATGSNLMIVKFKSDSQIERRGFRASWKSEPLECGGDL